MEYRVIDTSRRGIFAEFDEDLLSAIGFALGYRNSVNFDPETWRELQVRTPNGWARREITAAEKADMERLYKLRATGTL